MLLYVTFNRWGNWQVICPRPQSCMQKRQDSNPGKSVTCAFDMLYCELCLELFSYCYVSMLGVLFFLFLFLVWIHLVTSARKLNKHWLRTRVKIVIYVQCCHSSGPGPGILLSSLSTLTHFYFFKHHGCSDDSQNFIPRPEL